MTLDISPAVRRSVRGGLKSGILTIEAASAQWLPFFYHVWLTVCDAARYKNSTCMPVIVGVCTRGVVHEPIATIGRHSIFNDARVTDANTQPLAT